MPIAELQHVIVAPAARRLKRMETLRIFDRNLLAH
jgi:hypothetical protein